MTAKQAKNVVQEANRVSVPLFVSTRCSFAQVRSLNLVKDEIQVFVRTAVQLREESGLQLQEFLCNVGEIPSIHKQAAYDEDRLVVWLGRVLKFSKVPGFVDETDFQERLSKKKPWPPLRWPRGLPPARQRENSATECC